MQLDCYSDTKFRKGPYFCSHFHMDPPTNIIDIIFAVTYVVTTTILTN